VLLVFAAVLLVFEAGAGVVIVTFDPSAKVMVWAFDPSGLVVVATVGADDAVLEEGPPVTLAVPFVSLAADRLVCNWKSDASVVSSIVFESDAAALPRPAADEVASLVALPPEELPSRPDCRLIRFSSASSRGSAGLDVVPVAGVEAGVNVNVEPLA
jgi:hypothetical protein